MLLNYFLVAVRTYRKHAVYAVLNLLGLVLGYASLALVGVYLHHELTFDAFHEKADRIYRVTHHDRASSGFEVHWARTHADYVNELPAAMPEIEHLIRFQNHERRYLRVGEKKFRPQHLYTTDAEVFEVFDLELMQGDEQSALAAPHSVVISERLAKAYFGDNDPLGQEVMVVGTYTDKEVRHVVTGVMNDLPANTHLPMEVLLSFNHPDERTWWAYVYILLKPGARISSAEAGLPAFMAQHADNTAERQTHFMFQPLRSIHLHSQLAREIIPNGSLEYVRLLGMAGLLMLLIAVVNAYNLSMAMALGRSREMGMRSVLGAERPHLMRSVLAESVVLHLLAAGLGLLLAPAMWPSFQSLMQVTWVLPMEWLAAGLGGMAVVLGLLMGLPTALALTRSEGRPSLRSGSRGSSLGGRRMSGMRWLIGLQFAASLGLISSAWMAGKQWTFIQQKNLGLKPEQVLAIPDVPNPVTDAFPTFQAEMSAIPGVQAVAACLEVPSREIRDAGPTLLRAQQQRPEGAPMLDMQVISPQFLQTMSLELLAGEDPTSEFAFQPPPQFSEALTPAEYFRQQRRSYLINESAMRKLGFQTPESAIGQQISWSIGEYQLAYGPIAGVVKDFHQETLKNRVDPTIMVVEQIWLRTFLIKVSTQRVQETLAAIEEQWNELFPAYPLEAHFLDELYNRLYQQERRQLSLLMVLSGLALFIALMGLVSLLAFVLRSRVREMAIRRVLGAGFWELSWWMGRDYLLVLLLGALVAIPLSFWWVNDWLQAFAYRVPVSWEVYALALALVAVLVLLAVGLQILQGMKQGPAEVLREG